MFITGFWSTQKLLSSFCSYLVCGEKDLHIKNRIESRLAIVTFTVQLCAFEHHR